MHSSKLSGFFTSNIQASTEEIEALLENCTRMELKRNQFVLREGEHCAHTFFVEQGLLRQFSIDTKGKEHVLSFAPEYWFVSDRESAYFKQASRYFIQALEDTVVLLIDEAFIDQMVKKFPDFSGFNTRLLHNHIRHLQNRINMLLGASAEERYLEFVAMYPDILLRVPQAMVASYLGITPESLSRVRKDLATRNFKGR
ncbi:MAG: Crp/Fnr family transcriptional regulator [Bacteroidetes bacterium]|nr:Crp/Fnr family transcriptional regulator [Bacteroidota bacterium]MBS1744531.1 Crp/Fnr family transcriptional regulator [Bacteroidota bacterium]